MVGGEENLLFQDTLKRSISELILPEKTLKEIKTLFEDLSYCIYFRTFESRRPISAYENLPELPPEQLMGVTITYFYIFFHSLDNLRKR